MNSVDRLLVPLEKFIMVQGPDLLTQLHRNSSYPTSSGPSQTTNTHLRLYRHLVIRLLWTSRDIYHYKSSTLSTHKMVDLLEVQSIIEGVY